MSDTPVANTRENLSTWLTTAGQLVRRYGLVVVLAWIGFGKYAKMEARVLIEHSPLMSWIYDLLSVRGVAATLGTTEIISAVLIALRPVWPRVSAVGSALAVVLFLGTLSLLFTTPGLFVAHYDGVPVLGAQPGQVSAQGPGAHRCGAVDLRRCPRRPAERYGFSQSGGDITTVLAAVRQWPSASNGSKRS